MTLTTLDPTPALIVIDLQKGVAANPTVEPTETIIGRVRILVDAFRDHGWPVVLTSVTAGAPGRVERGPGAYTAPPGFSDLVDELDPQPSDHLITKQRRSAFAGTELDARLHRLGVTQVVLAGLLTSMGVESTARAAYDLGYHVVIAVDAVTDRDAEAHENSVKRIFPTLGETATTDEILANAARRSSGTT